MGFHFFWHYIVRTVKLFIGIVVLLIASVFISQVVHAATTSAVSSSKADPAAVQAQIDQRNKELADIQKQIIENQQKLSETQQQKQTVSSELNNLNTTIRQVDLGISASQISLQKLGLEIGNLQDDLASAQDDFSQKQAAMAAVFQNIQVKDQENPLLAFVGSKSLSDGLQSVQNLVSLNQTLALKALELQESYRVMQNTLTSAQKKKSDKELETENLKNRKIIVAELKNDKTKLLQETKKKESAYQQSLDDLAKRQAEIAAEIDSMESSLRGKIDYKEIPKAGVGILMTPVENPVVTQEHGYTQSARKLYRGKYHNGLDFGAPIGTPIFAAYDGKVVSVANQDLYCRRGAYGKYIAIQHPINLTTLYGHLSLQLVHEGDSVKRGQLIGYSGNTGYATGPHLHFGVYDSSTFYIGPSKSCGPKMPFGGDLNPRDYLSL